MNEENNLTENEVDQRRTLRLFSELRGYEIAHGNCLRTGTGLDYFSREDVGVVVVFGRMDGARLRLWVETKNTNYKNLFSDDLGSFIN